MERREDPFQSIPKLAAGLAAWKLVVNPEIDSAQWLFPVHKAGEYLTGCGFDHASLKASHELGFGGILMYSFRRSFPTASSANGFPLRVLQAISGHSDLNVLCRYPKSAIRRSLTLWWLPHERGCYLTTWMSEVGSLFQVLNFLGL